MLAESAVLIIVCLQYAINLLADLFIIQGTLFQ